VHSLRGLKFLLTDKPKAIAYYLENVFTPRDLCDGHHERWVEACVQDLHEAEGTPLKKESDLMT